MEQVEYTVTDLPHGALEASARFYADHLPAVREAASKAANGGDLVIILSAAGAEHSDWRQALARTLAREYSPMRVNVVGASDTVKTRALCDYLAGANGVTGHYCQTHE